MNGSDVTPFLNVCRHLRDVIVKMPPGLPIVGSNGDVDIFSLDPQSLLSDFVVASQSYPYHTEFRVNELGEDHIHFDAVADDQVLFRLDIHGSVESWTSIPLKPSFFEFAVGSSRVNRLAKSCEVPLLCAPVEAAVRYIEYSTYFWVGRDKVHHLDWIHGNLTPRDWATALSLCHYFLDASLDQSKITPAGSGRPTFRALLRHFVEKLP